MKRSIVSSIQGPTQINSAAAKHSAQTALQYKKARVRYRTMASLAIHQKRHKVTVVGSGNWGSTIAKVVAENVRANPNLYEEQVQMWVFEEQVTIPKESKHYDPASETSSKPQKLSELINTIHENVKYLPGITLPDNVVANPSLEDAVKDSTILIFNLPHQFIRRICKDLQGKIVPYARGISCIKGVEVSESGVTLLSELIGQSLGIYCGALSGANIASEIAAGKYSETTIAYDPPTVDSQHPSPSGTPGASPNASTVNLTMTGVDGVEKKSPRNRKHVNLAPLPADYPPLSHINIKKLFHRHYFHVRLVSDVAGVSLGGALKNVVALAAGWVDGLGWGDNAKAAVMRVGILEEVKFGRMFFGDSCRTETFTEESAGMADVVTSCMGGRNFRCAKLSITRGISIEEVEKTELNGQKLQGTLTAYEVNSFLKSQGKEDDFPLFTAVYNILEGKIKPEQIPDLIEPKIVD